MRRLAIAIAVVAGVGVLVALPEAPLHRDTLRDLEIVSPCLSHGRCATAGAPASLAGIVQGPLWPQILGLARAAHLPIAVFQTLVAVGTLAASCTLGVALTRLLEARVGLVAAGLFLALVLATGDLVVLWNPSLLPLPLVLATTSALLLARDRAWQWAIPGGYFAAVAMELHVVAAATLLVVVANTLVFARRPALAVLAAVVTATVVLVVGASSALSEAVFALTQGGSRIFVLLALAVVGTCLAARRFVAASARTRVVQALALMASCLVVGVFGASPFVPIDGGSVRYLHVALPPLAGLLAFFVTRAFSRHTRDATWIVLAGALPLVALGWLVRQPALSTFSLVDVDSVARAHVSAPSGPRATIALDAPDCRLVSRALGLLGAARARGTQVPGTAWRLVRTDGWVLGVGGPLARREARIVPLATWLDREHPMLCLSAPGRTQHCAELGDEDAEHIATGRGRFVAFADPGFEPLRRARPLRVTYTFPVRPAGEETARVVGLMPSVEDFGTWRAQGSDTEGYVLLSRDARSFVVTRDLIGGDLGERDVEAFFPPCLMETRVAEHFIRRAMPAVGTR